MIKKNLVYVSYIHHPHKTYLVERNLNLIKKYFNEVILVYSSNGNFTFPNNFCGLSSDQILRVPNDGYDFKKYRIGAKYFLDRPKEYTILINDSVSPVSDLSNVFSWIDEKFANGFEYLGFLENHEIRSHFQSWFLGFSYNALNYFLEETKETLEGKEAIIQNYEVRLSSNMIKLFKSARPFESPANALYYQPIIDRLHHTDKLYFIKNRSIFEEQFKHPPHSIDVKKILSYCSGELVYILMLQPELKLDNEHLMCNNL